MKRIRLVSISRLLVISALLSVILILSPGPVHMVGARPEPDAIETWSQFTNAEDHLSFRYPPGTTVTRPYEQNTTIELGHEAVMTILAWREPGQQSPEEWVSKLNSGSTQPWIMSPRPFETEDWTGVMVEVRGDPTKEMMAVLVSAQGRIYMITLSALSDAFSAKSEVFFGILRTLRFGTFPGSSIGVEISGTKPSDSRATAAIQCSGAPFALPTSGDLSIYYHEYLSYACNECNPGCDHTGIDVVGDLNTPVYAAYAGTLYHVGDCGIRIIHTIDSAWGGAVPDLTVQTYYTHLNWRRAVGAVSKGELIGGQGTCGGVGTHLHFSIAEQWASELCIGNTRDPSSYLGVSVNAHSSPQPKWVPLQCTGGCCGCLPASCCSAAAAPSNGFSTEITWGNPGISNGAATPARPLVDSYENPVSEKSAESADPEPVEPEPIENPVNSGDLNVTVDANIAKPAGIALEPAEAGDPMADTQPVLEWTAVEPQRIPPASTSYHIAKSVFGSGGGQKTSTQYIMNGTQGQSTDLNRRRSASYVLAPGYWGRWTPLVYDFDVHLPIVAKDH